MEEGHEYCHQRLLWCLQFILKQIFSWSFPLSLALFQAGIRVSIMTGFAQAKAH